MIFTLISVLGNLTNKSIVIVSATTTIGFNILKIAGKTTYNHIGTTLEIFKGVDSIAIYIPKATCEVIVPYLWPEKPDFVMAIMLPNGTYVIDPYDEVCFDRVALYEDCENYVKEMYIEMLAVFIIIGGALYAYGKLTIYFIKQALKVFPTIKSVSNTLGNLTYFKFSKDVMQFESIITNSAFFKVDKPIGCLCTFVTSDGEALGFGFRASQGEIVTALHVYDGIRSLVTTGVKVYIRGSNTHAIEFIYDDKDVTFLCEKGDLIALFIGADKASAIGLSIGTISNTKKEVCSISVYSVDDDNIVTSVGSFQDDENPFCFKHYASTKFGSSGSPIMEGKYIIGVHSRGCATYNIGVTLDYYLLHAGKQLEHLDTMTSYESDTRKRTHKSHFAPAGPSFNDSRADSFFSRGNVKAQFRQVYAAPDAGQVLLKSKMVDSDYELKHVRSLRDTMRSLTNLFSEEDFEMKKKKMQQVENNDETPKELVEYHKGKDGKKGIVIPCFCANETQRAAYKWDLENKILKGKTLEQLQHYLQKIVTFLMKAYEDDKIPHEYTFIDFLYIRNQIIIRGGEISTEKVPGIGFVVLEFIPKYNTITYNLKKKYTQQQIMHSPLVLPWSEKFYEDIDMQEKISWKEVAVDAAAEALVEMSEMDFTASRGDTAITNSKSTQVDKPLTIPSVGSSIVQATDEQMSTNLQERTVTLSLKKSESGKMEEEASQPKPKFQKTSHSLIEDWKNKGLLKLSNSEELYSNIATQLQQLKMNGDLSKSKIEELIKATKSPQ